MLTIEIGVHGHVWDTSDSIPLISITNGAGYWIKF